MEPARSGVAGFLEVSKFIYLANLMGSYYVFFCHKRSPITEMARTGRPEPRADAARFRKSKSSAASDR